MDHPLIGTERFAATRRTAYVPPITVGGRSVADRLDRHLAVLAPETGLTAGSGPADAAQLGAAQTVQLLREITPRTGSVPAAGRRRVSLRAPLRSIKRWIGF
jgi:hypothetical protein